MYEDILNVSYPFDEASRRQLYSQEKVPYKYREKMDKSIRAKIFQPFSALKGYEEAIRATEEDFKNSID